MLKQNIELPLFNRALMAKYPPGSTFKLINALIGMKEGVVDENTYFSCFQGFTFGSVHVGCHEHISPLNLIQAIQHSCNAYYCNVFKRIIEDPKFSSQEEAYINWRNLVLSFGFNQKFDSDLPNEVSGSIPNTSYYDKYYGKHGWKSLTIISLAIGQGELGITPLQMVNMAAIMANRGYYVIPHTVKEIEGQSSIDEKYITKHYVPINQKYFDVVRQGMEKAVNGPDGGTALIAAIPGITVCGKTGTAQNPHGDDHSIFIAFAPEDNPKIAISVYIENAGFGATYAAPVASLMIEKYLRDSISRPWLEKYVSDINISYNK